jgi:hypothetical protein
VFAAFLILTVLVLISPIAPFLDGNIVLGIEATTMAVATALVACKSLSEEIEPLLRLFRLVLVAGAIPVIWMIIQLLPLGYIGIANPIWQSTQQALGFAIAGSIGIDTGAGLLGLIQYVAVLAIVLVTMAVTRDRSRADGLLFALIIATTIMCLPLPELLSRLDIVWTAWLDVAVVRNAGILGVLLALTATIRAFERWKSARGFSKSNLIFALATSTASLAICATALVLTRTSNVEFSLVLSVTILLAIVVIRRFDIDIWGAAAIAAAVLTLSVSIVWIQYGRRAADLITAYADDTAFVGITQRILADAPWFGSGAGSFQILANVYREPSDQMPVVRASTAAAKVAVELGPPAVWLIMAAILLATAILLRGALKRGRDSFYPALGASCLTAMVIRGFADASILSQPISIVTAVTAGLALAQSRGRTDR